MKDLLTGIKYLALIWVVLSGLRIALAQICAWSYSKDKLGQLRDSLNGVKRTWPVNKWWLVFCIALSIYLAIVLGT